MRKLAMIMATFGFIAFAGMARADQKTESSVKTDNGTTLSGKHKRTTTKTVERADGSSTETKVETTMPKNDEKHMASDRRADDNVNVRDNDRNYDRNYDNNKAGVDEKVEHHTTLTGKKETKSTKKVENGDGSTTETTTTTTEPKKK